MGEDGGEEDGGEEDEGEKDGRKEDETLWGESFGDGRMGKE